MGHGGEANDLALERFRQYLLVLARLRAQAAAPKRKRNNHG
jgi:hypothetical protein